MLISEHASQKLFRIQRLKLFALSKGLNGPVQIGYVIGKSTSQTSDLLSGKAAFGEKVARSIEAAAQLPANWLDKLAGETSAFSGQILQGQVPLLTDAQVARYTELVDNFQPSKTGQEVISTSVPIKRNTFALRVAGDSMEPELRHGMVIIVEPDMEALSGDFVVAIHSSRDSTIKQLVKDGSDWYLKPFNDRYPIKALAGSEIIGVVRALEQRYR